MTKKLGFTKEDEKFIQSRIKSLARVEDKISERELRHAIYLIGVFAYRQFNKAGFPVSTEHPALSAPKKVWDKDSLTFVDERELAAAR